MEDFPDTPSRGGASGGRGRGNARGKTPLKQTSINSFVTVRDGEGARRESQSSVRGGEEQGGGRSGVSNTGEQEIVEVMDSSPGGAAVQAAVQNQVQTGGKRTVEDRSPQLPESRSQRRRMDEFDLSGLFSQVE